MSAQRNEQNWQRMAGVVNRAMSSIRGWDVRSVELLCARSAGINVVLTDDNELAVGKINRE